MLVVELLAAVVMWNRSLLGELAGHPLGDPRVSVEVADVGADMRASAGRFDAILLDVDNGPSAFTSWDNDGFTTRRAWRPRGQR